MRRIAVALILMLMPASVFAAAYLYDMGSGDSAIMDDFTRVTDTSAFTPDAGFGWDAAAGMKPYVQVYDKPIFNESRGSDQPPPIYTNALTEDCVIGSEARSFSIALPAGEYSVYVLCGTSHNQRYQYFDFDVAVGDQVRTVRFEGPYQFRNLRFTAKTDGTPLEIGFGPASKWVANAIMVWDAADGGATEANIAELEAQMYGLPPEEMEKWKLSPLPDTPPFPEDALSRHDLFRGFVIYHKPYLECIYPNTNPYAHELNPTLRIFATPGEYEPLTFAVRTLSPLTNVRVSAGDIGPIKAGTIDVRHVRYMKVRPNYSMFHSYHIAPDILEPFDAMDLPADESHRFWLTVQVPPDAEPGVYDGSITFSTDHRQQGRIEAVIPVKLRVLGITLKEDPSKLYGIYYRDPIDSWVNATDEPSKQYFLRKAEMERADLVAHGTRNIVMSAWCRPADENGQFTADWTGLEKKLELNEKYGFSPPYVVSINAGGVYQKYMKESPGSHLSRVKMPPQEYFDEMTAMTRFVESERVNRGWPEFLYYPIDEPSTQETSVKYMTELMKAVRAAGVKTYVTADIAHDAFGPMMPYVDVWCMQPFSWDRERVIRESAERGIEFWCYPNHISGENDHTPVAGARMTYGFGFWRSGYRTLIPWIYSADVGDPFNYLDGSSMDFMNRHDEDGSPMPVALWECFREGYDDYRYVYTLQTLIEQARAAGRNAAADKAQQELDYVWNAIDVQLKYKYDGLWAPEEFDVYRWLIARAILELQEAV
ncbi:MAG TPA: hypothetical protein DGT21_11995 [Armatimonadetes bacterium]|nr:hypothetical protein [Armatimonadota bacterium]